VQLGEPTGKGAPRQKKRGQRFRDLAQLNHTLALEPVGGMAGEDHQQRGWQKLHKPDHAEVEGAAGQVIDLPADRDCADLGGETRERARQQEADDGGPREQRTRVDGIHGRHLPSRGGPSRPCQW